MELFKVQPIFYLLHFLHIIGIECVAWYLLWQFGDCWPVWLVSAGLLATAQAQAGWTQHDYGHLSVFNNFKLNHLFHQITIGHLKGASSHWWNFRHFQHHVKPNIHKKDPDITLPQVFLLGDHLPREWGSQKRGKAPYNHQHNYFWILGPWFLLPGYFHLENIYFVLMRRDWYDVLWMSTFFLKFFYLGNSILAGGWATFKFYMFVRWLESHWFVFVTQMNHLPMEIGKDHNNDWVTSQLISTCNVEPGLFNNWFSGHLNFQIEHHLFPTMPRHNYPKVAPYVKDLCKKHNVTYVEKKLGTAFADIIRSLRKSGKLWFNAYYHID
ncbi:DgyrCDS7196 [Dimorphilus gyrociliatus]|nr:DgyrCDS7196 [Dimorphilus gyrociliatus]